MFSLFRSFFRVFVRTRSVARRSATRATRGRARNIYGAAAGLPRELYEEIIEEALSFIEEAEDILIESFYRAIETMASMPGNAGQASVFETYVVPAFEEMFAEAELRDGWPGVDIGEYMVFMGEIVEEGNKIMEEAYNDASSLVDDAESVL